MQILKSLRPCDGFEGSLRRLGDGSGGPWCVFWSKVCPKRMPKGCPKGVKRELKNRTPAKHDKCCFDAVFIGLWPCRHSQKSHIFGLLWGTKVGSKNRSTRKPLPSMPLEALVTSWRLFGRPVGIGPHMLCTPMFRAYLWARFGSTRLGPHRKSAQISAIHCKPVANYNSLQLSCNSAATQLRCKPHVQTP